MLARRLALAALAALLSLPLGCGSSRKKEDPAPTPTQVAPAKPAPPPPPAAPAFNVPFKGKYAETAKVAYRNGQRIRSAAGKDSTITIDTGKVVYHVDYQSATGPAHVTETYSFTQADMRPVGDGYDVPLVFVKMDSDTKSYNPDNKNPKIEARKQATGWEIGFLYADTAGVQGGMEFR